MGKGCDRRTAALHRLTIAVCECSKMQDLTKDESRIANDHHSEARCITAKILL